MNVFKFGLILSLIGLLGTLPVLFWEGKTFNIGSKLL
jgi:hypothetical protein